jgi:hypothetical protein
MSSYNLTDNVNESFEFTIGGVAYTMQEMVEKNQKDEKAGKEVDEKEVNSYMYTFITPKEAESPSIEEILKKQNIKVLQNFNTMFKTEFGIA